MELAQLAIAARWCYLGDATGSPLQGGARGPGGTREPIRLSASGGGVAGVRRRTEVEHIASDIADLRDGPGGGPLQGGARGPGGTREPLRMSASRGVGTGVSGAPHVETS
jgi:hypothetical protein